MEQIQQIWLLERTKRRSPYLNAMAANIATLLCVPKVQLFKEQFDFDGLSYAEHMAKNIHGLAPS